MPGDTRWALIAGLLSLSVAVQAHAACKIGVYAELPLQPGAPGRALVAGEVNGAPTVFILDTGAWASTMPYADARRLGVSFSGSAFDYTGYNIQSEGVGGRQETGAATFNMKLGSINLPKEVMTAVAMRPLDHGAAALVGRDLLAQHDIELDIPDHQVRLMRVSGCTAEDLDYWNKPYSVAKLESDGSGRSAILVTVMLNGHPVPAMLDSGAPESTITPEAARAAGATVAASDAEMGGIGNFKVTVGTARFGAFTLGDETVHDVALSVAPMWKYNKEEETGTRLGSEMHDIFEPKMLLGMDFLRSHRVMVANSMGVLVFSYVGGPVFMPRPPTAAQRQTAPDAPPAKTP